MNKNILKRILAVIFSVIVITSVVLVITLPKKDKLVYLNDQIGLLTKEKSFVYENETYQTYQSTTKEVKLQFETFNLNTKHNNEIVINDNYRIKINPSNNAVNEYVLNEVKLLGLNIIDGNIKITFTSGVDEYNVYDTFWIRNVRLIVNNKQYKANEDLNESDEYVRVIKLGDKSLKSILREEYKQSEELNFSISKKDLNTRGAIIKNNDQEVISYTVKNKVKKLNNHAYILITPPIELTGNITNDFNLDFNFSSNVIKYEIYLNNIKINNNLSFTNTAWSIGNNNIIVRALNKDGFVKEQSYTFTLKDHNLNFDKLDYKAYDIGLNELSNDDKFKGNLITDLTNYKIQFNDISTLMLSVKNNNNYDLIFQGKTITNRVIYMELYNYQTKTWDVVSSQVNNDNDVITLGYNYEKSKNNYLLDNEILVRVSSKNYVTKPAIDTYIYHVTDVQYISRNGSLDVASVANNAKKALKEMSDHLIEQFNNDLLEYVVMTGDFVQSTVVTGEIEWPIVMDNLINPLLEQNIPLGVVSGNHDVGALRENSDNGSDALDDELVYDLFYEHLGEQVFKDKPYYGGSYLNNRSHYDLITINNHEFLFLYLGWGSSIKGIHVSEQDINYAKTILEQYPNKTVVLALHEYMSNKENKSRTGLYVFEQLVKPYSNIKIVLSGHINGSSANIDLIDDNNDGIIDRKVFQLLTNFQEEAIDNLGASFMRRIGLDFTNDKLHLDLFSPVTNDHQIFVNNNASYVDKYTQFTYDFNLNNHEYGLLTLQFGKASD